MGLRNDIKKLTNVLELRKKWETFKNWWKYGKNVKKVGKEVINRKCRHKLKEKGKFEVTKGKVFSLCVKGREREKERNNKNKEKRRIKMRKT